MILDLPEPLDDIAADSANAALLELPDVSGQVRKGNSASEDRASGLLDHGVGELNAQQLVSEVHACQTVVDEQIAAHHLVDEELFDERHGRVVLERLSGVPGSGFSPQIVCALIGLQILLEVLQRVVQ